MGWFWVVVSFFCVVAAVDNFQMWLKLRKNFYAKPYAWRLGFLGWFFVLGAFDAAMRSLECFT